jgi:hypothetical protein
MKNKFSLATLIAMGLVIVSCTTDTDEVDSTLQKQNDVVYLKIADSISKAPVIIYAGDNTIIPPIKQ